MFLIDRMLVIVRPEQPFIDWIKKAHDERKETVSDEEIATDCSCILVPYFEDLAEIESCIQNVYQEIFDNELAVWDLDESKWPQNRSYSLFCEWFRVDVHSTVLDSVIGDFEESEFVPEETIQ